MSTKIQAMYSLLHPTDKAKKKSLVGIKIIVVMHFVGVFFFFCQADQIFYTQIMVAERAKKSRLKNSTAEFHSIQQFWLQLNIS